MPMSTATPYRAVIVDDERLAREELRYLLQDHPDVEPVGEADTVRRACDVIAATRPDVVFLDVQMRGESGFDLLERTDVPFEVIFVTGFDRYALRAFDVNARDYLLKPVRPDRLSETLHRLRAGQPRTTHAEAPTEGHAGGEGQL